MHSPQFRRMLEQSKVELIAEIARLFHQINPAEGRHGPTVGRRDEVQDELSALFDRILNRETTTRTSEITILLSDLRGFTSMAEQFPASSVIDMLNRYFSRMSEIIVTQHDGVIDKFMGDSIMVLFGSGTNRPDDLERALSCAVHMQMAMDEINRQNESLGLPSLYMGIGINTGTVITGKVGSDLHSEYTVIGDEVNLASRIEAYSLRGQILISDNTYQRAKDFIETGPPTPVLVKGKKDQVILHELLRVRSPAELSVPRRESRKSPRIDIDMPFTYQHVAGKKIMPGKYSGRILDIGYNGFLCTVPELLEVYSEIKLTLALSMLGGEMSDIYAKVLRSKKHNDRYLTNIEFTSIHTDARQTIKFFIDRIIQGV